jgi:hypothetical protein
MLPNGIYGSGWSALGQGADGNVYVITVSGTDVYVGGGFSLAGDVPHTTGIAQYSAAPINQWC